MLACDLLLHSSWSAVWCSRVFSRGCIEVVSCWNIVHVCFFIICSTPSYLPHVRPSVLRCCWLGLLTCKTHYRVGEPTAAWQFVDIRQHRSFDSGCQYVSSGQRQPPLSGVPVNKWLSTTTRERRIPPDSESGGIAYLFGASLSPHIGSAIITTSQQQQQQGLTKCCLRLNVSMISVVSIDRFSPNFCYWCILGQRWTD